MTPTSKPDDTLPALTPAPGEAGFSLSWQMLDPDGCAVSVTMRGPTAADWLTVTRNRKAFMAAAKVSDWQLPPRIPSGPAPAQAAQGSPAQAQAQAKPAPAAQAGPPAGAPGRAPAGATTPPAATWPPPAETGAPTGTPVGKTATGTLLELIAVKMQVTPKPDGKVELGFYSAGHRFADLFWHGSVENAVKFMAPTGDWEAYHFAKPHIYDQGITYILRYTLSEKLNAQGKPYKDIVTIMAA